MENLIEIGQYSGNFLAETGEAFPAFCMGSSREHCQCIRAVERIPNLIASDLSMTSDEMRGCFSYPLRRLCKAILEKELA